MDYLTNDESESESSWRAPDFLPGLGAVPVRTWEDPGFDPGLPDDQGIVGGGSQDAAVAAFGGLYD
jgi:hypothetical protein